MTELRLDRGVILKKHSVNIEASIPFSKFSPGNEDYDNVMDASNKHQGSQRDLNTETEVSDNIKAILQNAASQISEQANRAIPKTGRPDDPYVIDIYVDGDVRLQYSAPFYSERVIEYDYNGRERELKEITNETVPE